MFFLIVHQKYSNLQTTRFILIIILSLIVYLHSPQYFEIVESFFVHPVTSIPHHCTFYSMRYTQEN